MSLAVLHVRYILDQQPNTGNGTENVQLVGPSEEESEDSPALRARVQPRRAAGRNASHHRGRSDAANAWSNGGPPGGNKVRPVHPSRGRAVHVM